MPKSHKVQVTLEEAVYERVREIAERDDKSMARVVRESIVRYCVEPAERERRQRALERLFDVEAPAPADYAEWKDAYSRAKVGASDSDD